MKTRFDSFEEIDQQLRILQLRRSIDRESFVIHLKIMKNAVLPKNWLRTFDSAIYSIVFSRILKMISSKRKKLKN